jgi:hypothetical protein
MRRLAALLLLAPMAAWAGQAVVSWANPTSRTDGAALAASEIAGTRVQWSQCTSTGAFGTVAGEQTTTGTATSTTVLNLAAGNWCFRAFTRDTAGLESMASAVASKIVPSSAAPRPPTLTTIATTAYDARWDGMRYVAWRPVGSVPIGVACSATVPTVSGWGAVSRSDVRFTKSAKSAVILAECA